MHISLPDLAAATLDTTAATPPTFVTFGRQHYGRSGLRVKSNGGAVRPYYPPRRTRSDWSWKPSLKVQIELDSGARKCAPPAFDEYLATLMPAERQRVLANKHAFENGHKLKLEALERTFREQMEGWVDDNEQMFVPGGFLRIHGPKLD